MIECRLKDKLRFIRYVQEKVNSYSSFKFTEQNFLFLLHKLFPMCETDYKYTSKQEVAVEAAKAIFNVLDGYIKSNPERNKNLYAYLIEKVINELYLEAFLELKVFEDRYFLNNSTNVLLFFYSPSCEIS